MAGAHSSDDFSLEPRKLGPLAAIAAHDLNNVLAAVLGMASALKARCASDPVLSRGMETILAACERGRGQIHVLGRYAHATLEPGAHLSVPDLFTQVSEAWAAALPVSIQLDIRMAPALPPLFGHAPLLQEALQALLDNAREALEPQGGTITLAAALDDLGQVTWSVQDTGPGLAPEASDRALEPFFSTKPGHLGLGLTWAQAAFKTHGARLELHATPESGTEVRVSFPPEPKS